MKKSKAGLIANIISYTILMGAWAFIVFSLIGVGYNWWITRGILYWYEENFGVYLSFNLMATLLLIVATASIVYVFLAQEKAVSKRRR